MRQGAEDFTPEFSIYQYIKDIPALVVKGINPLVDFARKGGQSSHLWKQSEDRSQDA